MIEIKGVTKQFKNETAIDYRDITFEDGRSYMLLGASGCGKSTLLNMIAGILSPECGEIVIDGRVMSSLRFRVRCSILMKSAIIRRAERSEVSPVVIGAATIPNKASIPPAMPSQSLHTMFTT